MLRDQKEMKKLPIGISIALREKGQHRAGASYMWRQVIVGVQKQAKISILTKVVLKVIWNPVTYIDSCFFVIWILLSCQI